MGDETKSGEESAEAQEGDEGGDFPNPSRRETLSSLLGIGGLSVGSASGRTDGSASPRPRPWNRDVDAQGNDLFDLGSLTMAANSTAITDFEGANLSISTDGRLDADGVSLWEDADDDGLLKASDREGIDVGKVETDRVKVGTGSPVTGVWGDSGEIVPLLTTERYREATIEGTATSYSPITMTRENKVIVPFERLSFTNISQIYVSLYGHISRITSVPVTASWRLRDLVEDVPIPESETSIALTADTEYPVLVSGCRAPYDPGTDTLLGVEGKLSKEIGRRRGIPLRTPGIRVWGEIR